MIDDADETFATYATEAGDAAAPAAEGVPDLPARYVDLGLLGRGGMGEVRRVRDTLLDQTLALKVSRRVDLSPEARARFLREARLTARLQHPAVVSVHDAGELPDGRMWFTMREVRGDTLDAVLARRDAGWPLRRLVAALEVVCQAVAFAHAEGLLHRDLKPANIMIGAFGEVMVMDWGLARPVAAAEAGLVGTLAYMPPEQLYGEVERQGTASDVYGLGAILHHLLVDRPPHPPTMARGPRDALTPGVDGPGELVQLVELCLADAPESRPEARAVAAEMRAWLDGVRRRAEAETAVAEADALLPEIEVMRAQAAAERRAAREVLDPLPPHAPVEAKAPGWAREDQAAALERGAETVSARYEQALQSALHLVPDLDAAHARLAAHYQSGIEAAERRRDAGAVARLSVRLQAHARGSAADWLNAPGHLHLRCAPADAHVEARPFVLKARRLVAGPPIDLGTAPLNGVPLARGTYALRLTAPGHAAVELPVLIERGTAWQNRDPEGREQAIALPAEGELSTRERLVPAGWFISGGDDEAPDAMARRTLWADAFVIQRDPVSHAEYLDFINDLASSGQTDEAERHLPCEATGISATPRALYSRGTEGRFSLGTAGDGRPLDPHCPVTQINLAGAEAYAAWWAARTGRPWRLPHDQEWEKAARGVDGRLWPWGDHFDPTWCRMAQSDPDAPGVVAIGEPPEDISPYGVRGLAGNVRDLCANGYRFEGPPADRVRLDDGESGPWRMLRGGAWSTSAAHCRSAGRLVARPSDRFNTMGFRLVFSAADTPGSARSAAR
ncbi:MAG: SUMF1/EgtB/PvdO family nonheme iron enzyme [Myxococcales bacterium]|nr:SUMF1/EgtB/PvdO family nonheme iron enzyme [Myxococcales bacterium]